MEKPSKRFQIIGKNSSSQKGYLASYAKRQNTIKNQKDLRKNSGFRNSLTNKDPFFHSPQGKILDISTIRGEDTNLSIDSEIFDYKNIFNQQLRMKALNKISSVCPVKRIFSSPTLLGRKYGKGRSS
jgi:hypothetical protein